MAGSLDGSDMDFSLPSAEDLLDSADDAPAIRRQIVTDLIAEDICGAGDIIEWNHFTNTHGYPIYKLDFETHLGKINGWLATRPNLISDDTMRLFSALTHRASISIANMEL